MRVKHIECPGDREQGWYRDDSSLCLYRHRDFFRTEASLYKPAARRFRKGQQNVSRKCRHWSKTTKI